MNCHTAGGMKWAAAIVLSLLMPLVHANQVLNSSFDTDHEIEWNPKGLGLDRNGVSGNQHSGPYSLWFNPATQNPDAQGLTGSVSQSISLTKDAKYDIEFFLKGNRSALTFSFGDLDMNSFVNDPNGDIQELTTLDGDGKPVGTGWFQYSYQDFVAPSVSELMTFSFAVASITDSSLFLDDVSVTPVPDTCRVNCQDVPEPGSLLLVGVALAGLGLVRRRTTS